MTYRVEREQPDGTYTVDDGLTGLKDTEADATVKAYADNGITARKVAEDAPADPEPTVDTPEAVAADLAAYNAEVFPQPRVASDYALLEYHAGVEDALKAGQTPVDIGRDAAIQALARAAGKSPNPTSVTRYAQGVRRDQANAADAAAGLGQTPRPADVEGAMQEPTDPQPTTESPAAIGAHPVGTVIYSRETPDRVGDASRHRVAKIVGKNGTMRLECGLRVPVTDVEWTTDVPEAGNKLAACVACDDALLKLANAAQQPAPAEDADAPAVEPAPKARGKRQPKVTVADTLTEALTPEPEAAPRRPKFVATPVGKVRNPVSEYFVDTYANISAAIGDGHVVTHLARYPEDADNVLTLCGFPRGSTPKTWRRITTPTVVTCYTCRRVAGINRPPVTLAPIEGESKLQYDYRVREANNADCNAALDHALRVVFGSVAKARKLREEAEAARAVAKAARAAERAAAKAAASEAPAAA